MAIRHQMSTLKHSIRHQQAQLHSLENVLFRGPRPLPPGIMNPSPPLPSIDLPGGMYSPPPPSYNAPSTPTSKAQKRTSYDVLQGMAGPESLLPLPKRDGAGNSPKQDGIREGVPMDFRAGPLSPGMGMRVPSPTRTLSRTCSATHPKRSLWLFFV